MFQKKKYSWQLPLFMAITLGTSGCLKTRAQLREDTDERETSRAIPVQPAQDVHPQGQYVIDELKGEMTKIEGRLEDVERGQREAAAKSNEADKEALKKLEA